jgi:hypothetical protein
MGIFAKPEPQGTAESSSPKNVAADRASIENLGLAGEGAPMSPRPGIGPALETLTRLPRLHAA